MPATRHDILGWDVRTWSKALEYWENTPGLNHPPLRCLEIGAGPGGLSLWLALKGHEVICSNDLTAEHRASALHRKHGVTSIVYRDIDATNIPYEHEFDLIVFKSVLGGIHAHGFASQQLAMSQMHKALKPGGRLLFAENLVATRVHAMARAAVYERRGIHWRFLTLKEMYALLEPFANHTLHTTGVAALFGVSESQRELLARCDEGFFNRLVPRAWHYVAYGSATR